jgi:hypothetical protein
MPFDYCMHMLVDRKLVIKGEYDPVGSRKRGRLYFFQLTELGQKVREQLSVQPVKTARTQGCFAWTISCRPQWRSRKADGIGGGSYGEWRPSVSHANRYRLGWALVSRVYRSSMLNVRAKSHGIGQALWNAIFGRLLKCAYGR